MLRIQCAHDHPNYCLVPFTMYFYRDNRCRADRRCRVMLSLAKATAAVLVSILGDLFPVTRSGPPVPLRYESFRDVLILRYESAMEIVSYDAPKKSPEAFLSVKYSLSRARGSNPQL